MYQLQDHTKTHGKNTYIQERIIVVVNYTFGSGSFEKIGSHLHGLTGHTKARASHTYRIDMALISGSMLEGSTTTLTTKRLRGITSTPSTNNGIGHFQLQALKAGQRN